MLNRIGLFAALVGFTLTSNASAQTTLIDENFNGQNGGTPQLSFGFGGNISVPSGTVDLIGSGTGGTSFDLLPGNGLYVDMDGSTLIMGAFTIGTFSFDNLALDAGTYTLTFELAGSQRGGFPDDTLAVFLTSASTTDTTVFSPATLDPFSQRTIEFTIGSDTTGSLTFALHATGGGWTDSAGPLLDDVKLTFTPPPVREPTSLALWGLGALGLLAYRRRRMSA